MKTFMFKISIAFIVCQHLCAQNPILIKDIATSIGNSSNPSDFAIVNNQLVFAANQFNNGSFSNRELMVSNGTASGTQLVKDIMPGNASSEPRALITINGKVYFIISDNTSGINVLKPWVTDGTAIGTYPLITHPSARIDGDPGVYQAKDLFVEYQGLVYFSSYDTVAPFNNVIYQTDGTQAGTKIAIRLPNNNAFVSNNITSPIVYKNKLYFCCSVNANGSNLYSFDTTTKTPVLIKTNIAMYEYVGHAIYNNKLYFSGSSLTQFVNSVEPWVTDGSDSGTYELKNLNPNPNWGSDPLAFNVLNGKLYFLARPVILPNGTTYLYAIDSTMADTIITTIKKISNAATIYKSSDVLKVGSTLYFSGSDSLNGIELWISDGTTNGTQAIDIISGTGSTQPFGFIDYCNAIYFTGSSSSGSYILYKTNGTLSGTTKVPGLVNSPSVSGIGVLRQKIVYNNTLYFSGQYDANFGIELYAYDAQCNAVNSPKINALTGIKIFPNPSDGQIHILKQNRTFVSVSVYDISGKVVFTKNFDEEQINIDLSNCIKGFYYLKLDDGQAKEILKLTLQ